MGCGCVMCWLGRLAWPQGCPCPMEGMALNTNWDQTPEFAQFRATTNTESTDLV